MKNENAFNAFLSSEMKKLGTSFKSLKLSERYHIGIADFIVFGCDGKSSAIECKFVSKIKSKGSLLNHPVSGAQMSFLKGMSLAGVNSWVLIGVEPLKMMALIPSSMFPESGNCDVSWFKDTVLNSESESYCFPFSNVNDLVFKALTHGR